LSNEKTDIRALISAFEKMFGFVGEFAKVNASDYGDSKWPMADINAPQRG
jgi:hypothetical protein